MQHTTLTGSGALASLGRWHPQTNADIIVSANIHKQISQTNADTIPGLLSHLKWLFTHRLCKCKPETKGLGGQGSQGYMELRAKVKLPDKSKVCGKRACLILLLRMPSC